MWFLVYSGSSLRPLGVLVRGGWVPGMVVLFFGLVAVLVGNVEVVALVEILVGVLAQLVDCWGPGKVLVELGVESSPLCGQWWGVEFLRWDSRLFGSG
jgi:hypothetical protein